MELFFESLDPILVQLFAPIMAVVLGILVSILARKAFVAPLITLSLTLLYESSYTTWYMKNYYPEHDFSYTSLNIVCPIISLMISFAVVSYLKPKSKKIDYLMRSMIFGKV
ncbi:hypothetical protein [Lysinibacillus contaminans]|uniref:hypothetical protein n=1 Tax=Lysinibacillus contaminans TaxID=1293441 RepID=UPI0006AF8BDF|nr:hypothetical protein [Lysinibacillus contaminans]